jgi:hypothetical protein
MYESPDDILSPQHCFTSSSIITPDRFCSNTKTVFLHDLTRNQNNKIFSSRKCKQFVKVASLLDIITNKSYNFIFDQVLTFTDDTVIIFFNSDQIRVNAQSRDNNSIKLCEDIPSSSSTIKTYRFAISVPSFDDFLDTYKSALIVNRDKKLDFDFLFFMIKKYLDSFD